MIAHSRSSSLPGLLIISFGTAILPTSCSSAPNSTLRRRCASSASSLRDLERETHDALAVLAGVRVVGLDHVAEHQCRAAVGVVQLDQLLQARAPLLEKSRSIPNRGAISSTAQRCLLGRKGNGQAQRGERQVDQVDLRALAERAHAWGSRRTVARARRWRRSRRRTAPRAPAAGPAGSARGRGAWAEQQDERGPEREPAVARHRQHPARRAIRRASIAGGIPSASASATSSGASRDRHARTASARTPPASAP